MQTKVLLTVVFTVFIQYATFAQWSGPVDISPGAVSALLNESMGPCIGVSGYKLNVVWCDRFSTKKGAIYYTMSADTGMTWTSPIPITNTGGNAWNPAIVVNGSSIHVVWREIDTLDNHRSSHYRHSLDGGNTWGPDVLLDSVIANWPAVTVSGNTVYVANDIVTSQSPYNTEIFFLRSTDNGTTWSPHLQLTNALGRSEDEAIMAQGSHIHMAWNDNRYNNKMQIFYKHSSDYGITWSPDDTIAPPFGYGTMVSVDSANVDVPYAGAASGHYQIQIVQSADTGSSWGMNKDLTNDPDTTFYYPYMVRDGSELHLTYVKAYIGGQYLHSGDGGTNWDVPFTFFSGNIGITAFTAYTGCALHIIYMSNTDHHIHYMRNPTGNNGRHCNIATAVPGKELPDLITVYPDPFDISTTIQFQKDLENADLRIYNIWGQVVKTINFTGDRIVLERNNLPSGIYFLQVQTGFKVIMKSKIIISG
ncbi:MAG: T9SS type A sorting domain-containing protein [Bacteroidetes bacterium]|nr:T9SS type A sorting domain-containing protein [Bacteroidota bacterium]